MADGRKKPRTQAQIEAAKRNLKPVRSTKPKTPVYKGTGRKPAAKPKQSAKPPAAAAQPAEPESVSPETETKKGFLDEVFERVFG